VFGGNAGFSVKTREEIAVGRTRQPCGALIRRLGTTEDVARAALFLASSEAAWITGVVLDVAGGAVMPR
jgi:NAD(P)-dependent dehydrogenase (short-subunit alcohol dehydrogenase family)